MADPRVYDGPVAVAYEEALAKAVALLADVPGAETTFSERYGNPHLSGSPAALAEAASSDRAVRDEHGMKIMAQALVRIVAHQQDLLAHQQEQIEELKAAMPRSKR